MHIKHDPGESPMFLLAHLKYRYFYTFIISIIVKAKKVHFLMFTEIVIGLLGNLLTIVLLVHEQVIYFTLPL